MSEKTKNAVVQAAKQKTADTERIITLDDGMRIKLHRVSARLVSMATRNLEEPIPPQYLNEQTGVMMQNTSHPEYVKELQEYNKQIEEISLDAMIMFGIELLDPIPDMKWVKNLKRLGVEFDADDPDELEYYYKTQVAADPRVLTEISKYTGGLTDAQVNDAIQNFQSDAPRDGHSEVSGQGEG